MKTALCISGHIRTFFAAKEMLSKHFLQKYNPDVFVFLWTESFGTYKPNKEGEDYIGYDIKSPIPTKSVIKSVLDELKPVKAITTPQTELFEQFIEKGRRINPNISLSHDKPRANCAMFYARQKCNDLRKQHELSINEEYDCIVSTRFDLSYLQPIELSSPESNKIYCPEEESYGKFSDIFVYSNTESMDIYCNMYNEVEYLVNEKHKYNPHYTYKRLFEKYNIKIKTEDIKVKILR